MKVGIDIGGSHIGIGVIEENGKLIEKKEIDLNKEIGEIEPFIQNYISKILKEYMNKYKIELIGIASPGTSENGKIKNLVNLGIQELDIQEVVNEICDIPVIFRNDAKCAGLAEKKYGSLKSYSDGVFICLGTGIGGAVFAENKLLVSKRNSGYELGHMIIEKNGKRCNCGKRGCFETYCSIKRFKEETIEILETSQTINPQKLIETLKQRQDETKIREKIDRYNDDLIIGLSNIIDIFEPEAICLGGSFVYFKDILFHKLVEKFEQKRYVMNKQSLPKLKLAVLGNDAGIIGATIKEQG